MSKRSVVVAAMLLLLGVGAAAQEKAHRVAPAEAPGLERTVKCPVCSKGHRDPGFCSRYLGRHHFMDCEGCLQKFVASPDDFASASEPRSGLFHTPDPSKPRYGGFVFWFGVYVVIALLCGALAAYFAVQKGLPGGTWFAAGLLLNVIGVALVAARPAREMAFTAAGLAKIPTTHAPVPCAGCGKLNHPSAAVCAGCRKDLSPTVESEVRRLGGRHVEGGDV